MAAAAVLMLSAPAAEAQTTRTWIGPDGGNFNNILHWNPLGVPTSSDTALFNDNSAYAVTLPSSETIRTFRSVAGEVRFQSGASTRTFRVTGSGSTASVVESVVQIGDGSSAGVLTFRVEEPTFHIGGGQGSTGQLLIQSNGVLDMPAGTTLSVGDSGTGTLQVRGTATLGGNLHTAQQSPGRSLIEVGGAGASLTVGGTLAVGGGTFFGTGTSTLRVGRVLGSGTGGLVRAGVLQLFSSGTVDMLGGTLHVDSLVDSGGIIDWSGGTIRIGGSSFSTTNGAFGGAVNIGLNRSLVVDGTLVVDSALGLMGGTLSAQSITLTGTIYGVGTLDVGTQTVNGTLVGQGAVTTRVGGTTGTISATVGNLSLGNLTLADGYSFGGTLNVNGNTVTLQDADRAQLGVQTNLGAGGRLIAANGMTLAAGRSITATGSAVIDGAFTNGGTVNGPTGGGQFLTFAGDVDGTGNYTGNVLFSDGFSPGASPALVNLANVAFDGTTALLMEIGGTAPGTGHDRLVASGHFAFDGTLTVALINGFVPTAGQSFDLFDWATGGGTFDAVVLPSLSPGLAWDASALYTTGTLSVIPEPGTVAGLAGAVAVALALGHAGRQRRRARGRRSDPRA